jgi:hypothetical protein
MPPVAPITSKKIRRKPPPKSAETDFGFDTTMTTTKKKKEKKIITLPIELQNFAVTNMSKFHVINVVNPIFGTSTYGQEVQVVDYVTLDTDEMFNLGQMSIDQMRLFNQKDGVRNSGNVTKFECRQLLASFVNCMNSTVDILKQSHFADCYTSTICCLVNVVFHEDFLEYFKSCNDIKSRMDFESSKTYKMF